MNAIFAGASRMDGISAFKRLSVRSPTKKLGHYWICRLPGPRPIAHAAAQRFMLHRWRPDQTALSEPDVRFEAHCRLNSDIASCPKSAKTRSGSVHCRKAARVVIPASRLSGTRPYIVERLAVAIADATCS